MDEIRLPGVSWGSDLTLHSFNLPRSSRRITLFSAPDARQMSAFGTCGCEFSDLNVKKCHPEIDPKGRIFIWVDRARRVVRQTARVC